MKQEPPRAPPPTRRPVLQMKSRKLSIIPREAEGRKFFRIFHALKPCLSSFAFSSLFSLMRDIHTVAFGKAEKSWHKERKLYTCHIHKKHQSSEEIFSFLSSSVELLSSELREDYEREAPSLKIFS